MTSSISTSLESQDLSLISHLINKLRNGNFIVISVLGHFKYFLAYYFKKIIGYFMYENKVKLSNIFLHTKNLLTNGNKAFNDASNNEQIKTNDKTNNLGKIFNYCQSKITSLNINKGLILYKETNLDKININSKYKLTPHIEEQVSNKSSKDENDRDKKEKNKNNNSIVYGQSYDLSILRKVPPKIRYLHNNNYNICNKETFSKKNEFYGEIKNELIPNVFYNHSMIKISKENFENIPTNVQQKKLKYINVSNTKRFSGKLITISYFSPNL